VGGTSRPGRWDAYPPVPCRVAQFPVSRKCVGLPPVSVISGRALSSEMSIKKRRIRWTPLPGTTGNARRSVFIFICPIKWHWIGKCVLSNRIKASPKYVEWDIMPLLTHLLIRFWNSLSERYINCSTGSTSKCWWNWSCAVVCCQLSLALYTYLHKLIQHTLNEVL